MSPPNSEHGEDSRSAQSGEESGAAQSGDAPGAYGAAPGELPEQAGAELGQVGQGAGSSVQVSEREGRVLFACVVGLAFFLVLGVSYLDEDAFISFRVVDNFVHGFGLRWNVDERVQVYTNPLWVLALIPLHSLLGDISWASYLLSAGASTAAVATVARPLQRLPFVLTIGLLLPLLLSLAFTDYTSSGLENPFLYLFAALFIELLLRPDAFDEDDWEDTWKRLCLYAALSATTRADSFIYYAPVLLWLAWRDRKRLPLGRILVGASPLLLWLAFAYFYYGTVFPNPKYAKLQAGIDLRDYLTFGWAYLADMARNDVVTFVGLLVAPVGALLGLFGNRAQRDLISLPIAFVLLGASLYEVYVIWVGGDFMAGRHWAGPYFITVSAVALRLGQLATASAVELPTRGFLYACLALLGLHFVVQPMTYQRDVIARREQDRFAIVRDGEIRYQRYNCGFYEALFAPRGKPADHTWSQEGVRDARRAISFIERYPERRYVVVDSAAGKRPYHAGPLVIYIDALAITDPLLARLPDADGEIRLIGHLQREVPRGYIDARQTGDLSRMDPYLQKYYAALRLVVSGPLFDSQRIRTMLRMTGGAYDDILKGYIKSSKNRGGRAMPAHH